MTEACAPYKKDKRSALQKIMKHSFAIKLKYSGTFLKMLDDAIQLLTEKY